MAARTPKPKRRRERGDDGIHWDKVNKCYQGTISLGYDDAGKRLRRTVRGKTKQEVKDKLDELHDDLKAGVWTPATYTVKQCVMDSGRAGRADGPGHLTGVRSGRRRTVTRPVSARPLTATPALRCWHPHGRSR